MRVMSRHKDIREGEKKKIPNEQGAQMCFLRMGKELRVTRLTTVNMQTGCKTRMQKGSRKQRKLENPYVSDDRLMRPGDPGSFGLS